MFINSIPKSGTYFAEAAFSLAGFPALRLHLDGITGEIIDWRDIADEDVHRLENRSVKLPASLLVPLLGGGSIAGHVAHAPLIDCFEREGEHVIHLVRNLRDQMLSNYRALIEKGITVSAFESFCLQQPLADGLRMFYAYHHGRCSARPEFDMTRRIVEMLSRLPQAIVLRYEDFSRGVIPADVAARLDEAIPGLASELRTAFLAAKGRPSPTLSTARSNWRATWSDSLEAFFEAAGLDEINRRLGYTDSWDGDRNLPGNQHDPEQNQEEAGDMQPVKSFPEEQPA